MRRRALRINVRRLFPGVVYVVFLVSVLPMPVHAAGPTVGTNCTASWSAVTTHTDGSAVTGTITYNLYLAAGTPTVAPATPTHAALTGTNATPCQGLAPGQYTLWVTAVESFGTGASSSESVKSPAVPFALVVPSVPSGVIVK